MNCMDGFQSTVDKVYLKNDSYLTIGTLSSVLLIMDFGCITPYLIWNRIYKGVIINDNPEIIYYSCTKNSANCYLINWNKERVICLIDNVLCNSKENKYFTNWF